MKKVKMILFKRLWKASLQVASEINLVFTMNDKCAQH